MSVTHLVIAGVVPILRKDTPLPALPHLPKLQALLPRLRPVAQLACDEDTPETPAERSLAELHGLPQAAGQVPWAAFANDLVGTPCAWIRPCHLQLGMDSARVADPAMLALTEDESRALLATIAPYMAEDGITLSAQQPDRWLAHSPLFDQLATCSILRASQDTLSRQAYAVSGGTGDHADRLRRMQNEWQMLLADHPVNATRAAEGRPIVNALWIEGAGQMVAPVAANGDVQAEWRLVQAGPDIEQRRAAWHALDQDSVAALLAAQAQGQVVRLTLCGPRRAVTLQTARGLQRLAARWRPVQLDALRSQL